MPTKKSKPADIQTEETNASVDDFINAVANEQMRNDSFTLLQMMKKASGLEPKMWGPAIIGFGNVRLKYATGREVDMPKIGFSPRKANLSLYLTLDIEQYATTLARLGKHKTSVACLYINKLADIDMKVLEELIDKSLHLK